MALPRSSALVSLALVATLSGCTVLAPLATASTIATHNEIADDKNAWHYTAPVLVSVGVGLVTDVILLLEAAKAWSKPMT